MVQKFDSFATEYDRFCELTDETAWPWMSEAGVRPGGRILDVGCGAGRRCAEFASHFDEVMGIDLSAPLVEIAAAHRSGPPIRYLATDLADFADDDRFDVVYSHTMLHHVPDLQAALTRLKALVRPGGFAVLEDCVAARPTPPAWVYRVGAVLDFPKDVRKFGWGDAGFLFRFRTTGAWLAHLLSDRYLSKAEFREHYGAVFPGATFVDRGLMAMVWHNNS